MSEEPKLTRYTTAEEQAHIVGIDLDPTDVAHFLDLVEKGLVTSAAAHEAAVQNDMGLHAEVSVRLSRPVADGEGGVDEVIGRETVTGKIQARKVFDDPGNAPVVDG